MLLHKDIAVNIMHTICRLSLKGSDLPNVFFAASDGKHRRQAVEVVVLNMADMERCT